jgi:hypothetical protein
MTSNFCYHELIFCAALLRLLKLPKSLDAMKDIPQGIVSSGVLLELPK